MAAALPKPGKTEDAKTEGANGAPVRADTSKYSGPEKAAIILLCLGEEAKKLWETPRRGRDQGNLASDVLARRRAGGDG